MTPCSPSSVADLLAIGVPVAYSLWRPRCCAVVHGGGGSRSSLGCC